MLEKLLTGPKTYYLWLLFLLAVIAGSILLIYTNSSKNRT